MSGTSTEQLIHALVQDLPRVRRLGSPVWPILTWALGLLLMGVLLFEGVGGAVLRARFAAVPDLWVAMGAAFLTAVLAAAAAVLLSRPDRPGWLAFLPVPSLLAWVCASGLGCLRSRPAELRLLSLSGSLDHCLPFILLLSVPLSVAMVLLLRPARPLRPALCAVLGGLAVAAASAAMLAIIHPFDASAADLLVHAAAVAAVVAVMRYGGAKVLGGAR